MQKSDRSYQSRKMPVLTLDGKNCGAFIFFNFGQDRITVIDEPGACLNPGGGGFKIDQLILE